MSGQGRDTEPESSTPRKVRARAVVLSFLFTPLICYATTQQPLSTPFSLIVPPVGLLIVLVALNAPFRRWLPKLALTQADLIVIFSLTAIAAAVGSEYTFVGHAAIHEYPLEPDNAVVKNQLMVHMPDWLVIKDKSLVEDISGGGKGAAYVLTKLPVFFPRYVWWVALLTTSCLAMLCINSLMRNMWCRKERLAFPLIQLPVAMAEKGGGGAIWRSKLMWGAFGTMFVIDMLNGFNYLYPNVPSVPTKILFDLGPLFKEQPMASLSYTPIAIFPFMTAIGFFMPSDMLFSMIVFYLLRKVTHVVLAANGMPQGLFSGTFAAPGPPYWDEQSWGAIMALFMGAIWFSKGYLKGVWADIRSGAKAEDGGLTHRWAFVGLLVCFLGTMSYGMIGGLPFSYMAMYVGLYLVFSVVLTRMRAQIGPPTHEFAFLGPNSVMNRFFGTKWLSERQATWINQVYVVFNRIHRNHPMPYQLEAIKITSLNRLNQRSVWWAIAIITPFALFVAFYFQHVRTYRTGEYAYWNIGAHYLNLVLTNRTGPSTVGITMTLVGFTMVMVLDAVRFRFPGFPLHPAGYLLSLNYGVDFYWFGMLLALIIKVFIQRYYGLRGYEKLRAIAMGILIGEYAAELIWMSMALITNQSTYTISLADRDLGRQ
jgi:hypothetical protein